MFATCYRLVKCCVYLGGLLTCGGLSVKVSVVALGLILESCIDTVDDGSIAFRAMALEAEMSNILSFYSTYCQEAV